MSVSAFLSWLRLRRDPVCKRARTIVRRENEEWGGDRDRDERGRTMKRVLMTHNGLVQIVLVAPAAMAERM